MRFTTLFNFTERLCTGALSRVECGRKNHIWWVLKEYCGTSKCKSLFKSENKMCSFTKHGTFLGNRKIIFLRSFVHEIRRKMLFLQIPHCSTNNSVIWFSHRTYGLNYYILCSFAYLRIEYRNWRMLLNVKDD